MVPGIGPSADLGTGTFNMNWDTPHIQCWSYLKYFFKLECSAIQMLPAIMLAPTTSNYHATSHWARYTRHTNVTAPVPSTTTTAAIRTTYGQTSARWNSDLTAQQKATNIRTGAYSHTPLLSPTKILNRVENCGILYATKKVRSNS